MLFLGDLLRDPNGQAFGAKEQLSAAGNRSSACLEILQGILATKLWRNRWGVGGLQSNVKGVHSKWKREQENDRIMGEWDAKERKEA